MSIRRYALTVLAAVLLTSCGGSDGDDEVLEAVENAVDLLDGYVTIDGFRDTVSGIRVGDQDHLAPAKAVRGFVSFNMPTFPPGVTIERANIRLYQRLMVGNPFGPLQVIKLDHVAYGIFLDPGDYNVVAIKNDVGTISDTPIPGFRTVDVTTQVINAVVAGDPRLQFRLRFTSPETDMDGLEDTVRFEDGDNSGGTGNVPVLIIQYKEL